MSQTASLATPVSSKPLDEAINRAVDSLRTAQRPDGHWVYELEADATIPAEYVLLRHYLGEAVDTPLETKIGSYLRRIQGAHGGWALFHDGEFDISATVKAYFALKMMGDDVDATHMRRAREAIRARGGAEQANVFTRALLALFGIIGWKAVPVMPVEIMLLPRWFPFHLDKISYWARTVIVPLLVLGALKPRAKNPLGVRVDELFVAAPSQIGMLAKAPHQGAGWFRFFSGVDNALRVIEPHFPTRLRKSAIDRAVSFVTERLNGEDGLGAIFPAMANSVMMFDALGFPPNHADRAIARHSIDKLLVEKADEAYCQPCVSPVWDTALACHALMEAGTPEGLEAADAGLEWLLPLQVLDLNGDWIAQRPNVRPGGWAFQYNNAHYPDLDDTAVIVMAMDRARRTRGGQGFASAIARGAEWVKGLQSRNGGWGAFDADNNALYLNNIPFSDHGALLDPPTEDLTGRCVSMFAQLGEGETTSRAVRDGVAFLRRTQRPEGSWYGRWGLNYIYGTWSALCALRVARVGADAPEIRRAAEWLLGIQNADGGWGEGGESYKLDYRGHEPAASTASQTAWALLALMAADRAHHPAVSSGIAYLLRTQGADGAWEEQRYTGTGFPRVFYLRYHGYSKFFPLWAIARFKNALAGVSNPWGM